jgi:hypothetical protein
MVFRERRGRLMSKLVEGRVLGRQGKVDDCWADCFNWV